MKRVKCKSGLEGYECKLQESYSDMDEWLHYAQTFGLARRLGYDNAVHAWDDNPTIQGSVIPSDFCRVETPETPTKKPKHCRICGRDERDKQTICEFNPEYPPDICEDCYKFLKG